MAMRKTIGYRKTADAIEVLPYRVGLRRHDTHLGRSGSNLLRRYTLHTKATRFGLFETYVVDMQPVVVGRSIHAKGDLYGFACVLREIELVVLSVAGRNRRQRVLRRVGSRIAPRDEVLFAPCCPAIFGYSEIETLVVGRGRCCNGIRIGECRIEGEYHIITGDSRHINDRSHHPSIGIGRRQLNGSVHSIFQCFIIVGGIILPRSSCSSTVKRRGSTQHLIKCEVLVISPIDGESRRDGCELFHKRYTIRCFELQGFRPVGIGSFPADDTYASIVTGVSGERTDSQSGIREYGIDYEFVEFRIGSHL